MEKEIIMRLKEILLYLNYSPSKLADDISINRSRLSHILNGRNNPTLEVIQGILLKFYEINPDWLLFGKGNMLRTGVEPEPKDLFQYSESNKKKAKQNINSNTGELSQSETERNQSSGTESSAVNKTEVVRETKDSETVKRITVYYNNGLYQDFNPS